MKQTLLDMTQNILSAMSSDEVNSISDTSEALQVAQIIKNKYFDIVSRSGLPENEPLFQLEASADIEAPVLMYVPDSVSKIDWLKYFNSNPYGDATDNGTEHDINVDIEPSDDTTTAPPPGYQYVTILPIAQFLDYVGQFNPTEDGVETFEFANTFNGQTSNYTFYYKNYSQPTYCCVIANKYVIFDSYDDTQDTTLQGSKTMGFGVKVPFFKMQDDFIPQLEDNQFPLLVNEAKALAFFELKQQVHPKAEQESKRQWSATQRNKVISGTPTSFDALPNFGRNVGMGWGRTFNRTKI